MRQKSGPEKAPAEQIVKDIRRATRRQFSAEEKIRIVLEGVRGEESIAELCRRDAVEFIVRHGRERIVWLIAQGVPSIGLRPDASRYFDWHHSADDTLDKVDPAQLKARILDRIALMHQRAEAAKSDVAPHG